jgi:CRISPR-associated endonuclease/helicase Cas3
MSRFQWPMTFGAINNDALWIIDEVQLQGVGASTAAQLQGLREKFGTIGMTNTTFMTATLDRRTIATPDYALDDRNVIQLTHGDLAHPAVEERIGAIKILERLNSIEPADIIENIAHHHRPGTLTLIVLNTVKRVREVHKALLRGKPVADIVLLHSRFRSGDRARIAARLYDSLPEAGRIAICTQVVEAGVDLNAALLISDLAPWSSMVQRFGRCNRNGKIDDARIIWLDPGDAITTKQSPPYALDELLAARDHLLRIDGKSVGPRDLPIVENSASSAWSILRRTDLFDLFDTSTDVMGHDVDVSAYIRDTADATVSIFWRNKAPSRKDPPRREEFCTIRIGQAKEFIATIRPGLACIVDLLCLVKNHVSKHGCLQKKMIFGQVK